MQLDNSIPYGTSPDGFIPSMAISNFLIDKQKILIIGDFTKRDYSVLHAQNKDITVIDIVPIQGIEKFYLQSITEKTPFNNESFDGIVLAEVIEHLFEDHIALQEIHRILKKNGTLVITLPYFSNQQDAPEYHVRVHSQKTIKRLLQYCGFSIKEHFFRGLISRLPQKNRITKVFTFGIRKILCLIYGRSKGDAIFRKICFSTEYFLGTHKWSIFLQKYCTSFGGIMMIKKDHKIDFMHIQKKNFTPKDTK